MNNSKLPCLGPLAQSVEQRTFNPVLVFPKHQYDPVLSFQ